MPCKGIKYFDINFPCSLSHPAHIFMKYYRFTGRSIYNLCLSQNNQQFHLPYSYTYLWVLLFDLGWPTTFCGILLIHLWSWISQPIKSIFRFHLVILWSVEYYPEICKNKIVNQIVQRTHYHVQWQWCTHRSTICSQKWLPVVRNVTADPT